MFMFEYKDIGWWYWLVTAVLLSLGIMGNPDGFLLAMGLTVFQLGHFYINEKSIGAFSVQVRFWYLILLIVSWFEPFQLLYWVPTIGTWAQIIFGYCAMARIVSLFPWNKEEKFSMNLLYKTFLSRPVRGSVKQGFTAES